MAEPKNKLYYGDNLDVLRRWIPDNSVDLVYLDPPFNSRQEYSVLFAEKDGSKSSSQIRAFEDTWEWSEEAELAYQELVEKGGRVSDALRAFRTFLGTSDMMAYLAMMAPRLIELRRVMKETASIYLHCDPTASHYLKILMDGVFGGQRFVNEITWKRTTAHSDARQGRKGFGNVTDTILFYGAGLAFTFKQEHRTYSDKYLKKYAYVDETNRRYRLDNLTGPGGAAKGNPSYDVLGVMRHWRYSKEKMSQLLAEGRVVQTRPGSVPQYKRYLDEMPGTPIQNLWDDIFPINSQAQERLGYPTQKPEALLERILKASSNEGDVVLDPFCGCGTTVQVAQKLNRRWIGIDITHLAIGLIKKRLSDTFGEGIYKTYEVIGEPTDLAGARQLAGEKDRYQFQSWALGLCMTDARPTDLKKGADRGVDGRSFFHDDRSGKTRQILYSVKSGHVSVQQVRDLRGTVERENAEIGVFLCIEQPTKPMLREAAEAGFYASPAGGKYARLQILTVEELMAHTARVEYPRLLNVTLKQAPRHREKPAENMALELEPSDD